MIDRTPIPVAVLTGFLGSGKTLLLNTLLKDEMLANACVIINEFGEIGIDHLLVEKSDDNIVELSSGCLCCTIRGDLIDTISDLLLRRDKGEIKAFDRIVIETTGLADPAPVLHALMRDDLLLQRLRLEGVITCVDGVNGWATLDTHHEAVKQVAVADRIVLTKLDLLHGLEGEEKMFAIIGRLRKLNPGARLLTTHRGEATAARLFTMCKRGWRTRRCAQMSMRAIIMTNHAMMRISVHLHFRMRAPSARKVWNCFLNCCRPITAQICCA
jgi:G3E family GTPase